MNSKGDGMMDGWMSGREVVSRFGYKILIAGLSQAGKTAVKRIFFMKQRAEDVAELAATIEYERMAVSIANVPITTIDLGGQRVFIRRFLNSFSPFIFSSVHILIFVIDVAAKSTKNNAIQYFSSCVEKLKNYSPNAEYFVFLHKNDLVRGSPNYESIHSQLKEQFQLECHEKIHFLRTTIYKPETVVNAFGRIFEITIPEIARSEYVEGRTIGQVEEYAEKFAAVELQDACCLNCGTILIETSEGLSCNFCGYERNLGQVPISTGTDPNNSADTSTESENGDSITLEQLQQQLQELIVENGMEEEIKSTPTTVRTDVAVNGSDDSQSVILERLQAMMKETIVDEDSRNEMLSSGTPKTETTIEPAKRHLTYLHDAAVEEESKDSLHSSIERTPLPDETESLDISNEMYISFLTSFYGIKEEEAVKLVQYGCNKMFETAARSGVPVNLLLDIYLKYIPFLKNRELFIENYGTKLEEMFLAYLNELVEEDELFDCLTFIARSPELSMEEIIENHLIKKREERKLKKAVVVQDAVITKINAGELDESIIPLSSSDQIGFKAEKAGSNCRVIFFQGNHRLGSNLISKFVSVRELQYLLSFEAKLPIKGNYKDFVEKSAPIIHETIEKMFNTKK
jgi:GTPase SAR1 family protein